MRRLLIVLGVAAVFVVAVAATLPVDSLVRRALAAVHQPGQPELVFERAALRPSGLVLENAALRDPQGKQLAATPWIALRPSVVGLVRGTRGFPWTFRVTVCGTVADVTADTAPGGIAAEVRWQDADLGVCKGVPVGKGSLVGHVDTTARLTFGNALPAGEGQIALRDAVFKAGPPATGLIVRAATTTVRWTLSDGRLELPGITLAGPDAEGTGRGEVRLGTPFPKSEIDLDLDLTPGTQAPPILRALLDLLPPPEGEPSHRRLVVTGTVEKPEVVR